MSGSLEAESVAARRWRIRCEEKREKLWKRRDESYLVSKRIVGNGLNGGLEEVVSGRSKE